jgi:hypothetical protein
MASFHAGRRRRRFEQRGAPRITGAGDADSAELTAPQVHVFFFKALCEFARLENHQLAFRPFALPSAWEVACLVNFEQFQEEKRRMTGVHIRIFH